MSEKWITIAVATVLSVVFGGGSGLLIETEQQSQLRTQVAKLTVQVETLQGAGSKQSEQLDEIADKIEEGNKYLRDEIVRALSEMQADIAVLKARR